MGRTSFVAWLFIMAAACVVIAIADQSFGWFIGGIVFSAVAMYALRQLSREHEEGQAAPRLSFVGLAMLAMVCAMFFLFWLQTSA